jgi:hypothetical protein
MLNAIWAIVINMIAWNQGFYKLPTTASHSSPLLKVTDLGFCFLIYLSINLVISPLIAKLVLVYLHHLNPSITTLSVIFISYLQLVSMVATFLIVQAQIYRSNRFVYVKLWKNRKNGRTRPFEFDIGIGALTWLLSFPIVSILGDVAEKLLQALFGYSASEQVAVKFVKLASEAPIALVSALISVIFMAPFVEEFLFRGLLQTFLRKRAGSKSAVLLSALLFAVFHFSFSQGLGNITFIFSLFILGLFLGILYERQRSLWAPIGLHMTFNIISALRILFASET